MHPFLKKLLDGENVEWKPLGEVAEIKRGRRVTKSELIPDGTYPVYSGGVTPMGRYNKSNQDKNTITIVKYGTAGFVNFITEEFWANDVCYCVIPQSTLINKFLFYVLTNKQREIYSLVVDAIPAHLPTEEITNLPIPIPAPNNPEKSLAIQNEIVRMLDTFTKLISELTRELGLRKKQYQYYRDKLLDFKNAADFPFLQKLLNGAKVEYKPLGEVTTQTKNINWKNTLKTYQYIDLTSVSIETNTILETSEITAKTAPSRAQKLLEKDDVIFATTRPTQQRCCVIDEKYDGEIASTGYCVLRAKKYVALPKWIFYCVTSNNFKKYLEDNQSGAAYPAISDSKIKEYIIPIPPIEAQNQIVDILDKFDALTNSLTEGLPKEIELRKKQYAYYRDLLLNFPKPEPAPVDAGFPKEERC
ncbi:restriction endonuclease subunit S [Helicobacter sp. 11S02596-1]|uniref:restriction endonuclease subunit S n=1 Tax=Helicobacter sp. 11S02596-1 TaxID=1476194 RepID=UPI000BA7C356|nr:restriction endonuclease subunit S [Helicobacter sp. 11S02596-1]PAF44318.1 hypothetical protein BJI48_03840 [Helicobacter sp. 11S02596-1]